MVRHGSSAAAWWCAALAIAIAAPLFPSPASAQRDAQRLESLRDLQGACRRAEGEGPRELLVVAFPGGSWSFGRYEARDGFLSIDTRRNLRAFGGGAELFPSGMEEVGFIVTEERAEELRRRASGLTLKVAFFLGFDNSTRTLCLVRPAVGVTTVRMDVAYLELTGRRNRVVARQDTDRLRAWMDDAERDAIPGEGPRGAVGAATRSDGAGIAPESWQQVIAAENRGGTARALGRCHAQGIRRGASDGTIVVRVQVDPRSGHIGGSEVELSSVGDDRTAACVARALSRITFPPDASLGSRVVLSLPVRLVR
jgi:hypothetical protein